MLGANATNSGAIVVPTSLAMVGIGIGMGLGGASQSYMLIVQNAVDRRDLGIATAATQFFRSAGDTVGIAVLGTAMTSRLGPVILGHLPEGAADGLPSGGVDAGSVLDPAALTSLREPIAVAVRQGLADAMHTVFWVAISLAVVAVLATILIRAIPLRTTLRTVELAAGDGSSAVGVPAVTSEPGDAEEPDSVTRPAGASALR